MVVSPPQWPNMDAPCHLNDIINNLCREPTDPIRNFLKHQVIPTVCVHTYTTQQNSGTWVIEKEQNKQQQQQKPTVVMNQLLTYYLSP